MSKISNATKERLLNKIKSRNEAKSILDSIIRSSNNNQKKKSENIGDEYIDDNPIIILPKKVRHSGLDIIINQSEYLDFEKNEAIDVVINHRLHYIQTLVEKQANVLLSLTEEELKSKKREIVVAVHQAWIDQFMDNACIIDVSDRKELIDSRIIHFFNHRVVILNHDVKDIEVDVEYQGLCILYEIYKIKRDKSELIDKFASQLHPIEYKFLKLKKGCDIIVHRNSWKYFLCMQFGIDFFNCITKNKIMMEYYPDFNIYDILVISKEFGKIRYPEQKEFENFLPNWVHFYDDWKNYTFF